MNISDIFDYCYWEAKRDEAERLYSTTGRANYLAAARFAQEKMRILEKNSDTISRQEISDNIC